MMPRRFVIDVSDAALWDIMAPTRPLALAPAMLDSPVGVAAWMVDKFHAWSDQRSAAFGVVFPFDRLLTEIMLYLVTDTVETATWIYSASRAEGLVTLPPGRRVEVPTAVAAFPDPAFPVPPRAMVERSHDVVRYTPMERGPTSRSTSRRNC